MSVGEVLISELAAVDGLATSAVALGEIAALSHEAGDDSVEGRSLIVERLALGARSFLTSAESAEVFGGVRCVSSKINDNSAFSHTTDRHIKEHS